MRNPIRKVTGQGMTEYIIIVALIAIAAIGVFTGFGDVVRNQVGIMAGELAGEKVDKRSEVTAGKDKADSGANARTLGNFEEGNGTN